MYVLFVDLLGFASNVTALSPRDEQVLLQAVRQAAAYDTPIPLVFAEPRVQNLYKQYVTFQKIARYAVHRLAQSQARSVPENPGNIRSVVFSDSLFIACDDSNALLRCAADLVPSIVGSSDYPSPVRAGLAEGAFTAFEWAIRASEGNLFYAEVPFLGSGVVRAYQAESMGAPGLRIVIHPSAAPAFARLGPSQVIALPQNEVNDYGTHEVNLVWWPSLTEDSGMIPRAGAYEILVKKVKGLQESAPDNVRPRYDATLAALGRMLPAERRRRPAQELDETV